MFKSYFQVVQLFLLLCINNSFYWAYWLSFTWLIFFCEFIFLRTHLVWESSLTHSHLYCNLAVASFAPGIVIVLIKQSYPLFQGWEGSYNWFDAGHLVHVAVCSGPFLCEHGSTFFTIHFWSLPSHRPFIDVGFPFFDGAWQTFFLACEQDCTFKCFKNSYLLFLTLANAYTAILICYISWG